MVVHPTKTWIESVFPPKDRTHNKTAVGIVSVDIGNQT